MPGVTIVFGLHQPMYLNRTFPYERLRRIAEESSLMDKYVDYALLHRQFIDKSRWVYGPAINGFLSVAEETQRTNSSFKFALALSGLFIEQLLKEDTALVASITRLVGLGAVEILAGTYYNSPASVYPAGEEEFEEQVRENIQLVKKVFGVEPKVLVNTKLIYSDGVAKCAETLGLSGVIADFVPGLTAPSCTEVYSSGAHPTVRILVRNPKLSREFVQGDFEAGRAGSDGVNIIYVDGEDLPRADISAYRNLALSIVQRSVETILPRDIIENTSPSGNLSVPEAARCASYELNGDVSTLIQNPMQRMFYERVSALAPYVKEIDDPRIKGLWRILQQVDHLYCMDDSGTLQNPRVFSSSADAFSVCNTILVDFEGKVGTLVQRLRKAKAQAAQAALHPTPQPAPAAVQRMAETPLQSRPLQKF